MLQINKFQYRFVGILRGVAHDIASSRTLFSSHYDRNMQIRLFSEYCFYLEARFGPTKWLLSHMMTEHKGRQFSSLSVVIQGGDLFSVTSPSNHISNQLISRKFPQHIEVT